MQDRLGRLVMGLDGEPNEGADLAELMAGRWLELQEQSNDRYSAMAKLYEEMPPDSGESLFGQYAGSPEPRDQR